jgi:DNA polymerase I-like protein with 3'-5' exonuclease and polymerase domains
MEFVLDYEVTTSNKGNPFDTTNSSVCFGLYNSSYQEVFFKPYPNIQSLLDRTTLLIGFNLKFDLHWLRRDGFTYTGRVWDCQLVEFILNAQSIPYPSLDDCAEKYGLPKKVDIVKTEYWDKGINTDQIPKSVLQVYCAHDTMLTYRLYLAQKQKVEQLGLQHIVNLCLADLLVLEEMEWNGLFWDETQATKESSLCEEKLHELRSEILGEHRNLPINLNSNDHLSVFLYGGSLVHEYRVPIGVYKTGNKIGLPRNKVMRETFTFPRKFEPPPKSALQKEGYFSTDEVTLKTIKASKKDRVVLEQLDQYAKIEKLKGTYYDGYNKLRERMNWPTNRLFPQYNQVVAKTGRLSSSNPNGQNQSPEAKQLMYSRY